MCIYVPRAPRPAETPEVMGRLHGVQALFKGEEAGKRRCPRGREATRRKRTGPSAAAFRKDGAFLQAGENRVRKRRGIREKREGRARGRLGRQGSAPRRKLVPACLVCVDITILVAVLCALYAPESLPAQLLSSFAAGR